MQDLRFYKDGIHIHYEWVGGRTNKKITHSSFKGRAFDYRNEGAI